MVCIASTSSYFDYKYVVKQLSLFFNHDATCLHGVFLMAQHFLCQDTCLCLPVDRNVGATIEQRQQFLV